MPDPKTYKQHFENKHPSSPLPPELKDVNWCWSSLACRGWSCIHLWDLPCQAVTLSCRQTFYTSLLLLSFSYFLSASHLITFRLARPTLLISYLHISPRVQCLSYLSTTMMPHNLSCHHTPMTSFLATFSFYDCIAMSMVALLYVDISNQFNYFVCKLAKIIFITEESMGNWCNSSE